MILGNIIGKTSTQDFRFLAKGTAKKFQYIQVPLEDKYILGQIVEIEKDKDKEIAFCNIIGYRDNDKLKPLLRPLEPNTEVLRADDDFIKQVLGLKKEKNSAFFGNLQGYDKLNVYLDLNKLLTKHIVILAKSGSGKSYAAGVLVEEILDKEIPLLIIDPHGEYASLKEENKDDRLLKFNLKPKSFKEKILEYSPVDTKYKLLKLNNYNLSSSELIHLLPAKLSNSQLGLLYSALKDTKIIDFNQLILELETEDNNAKYGLINIIQYLQSLKLFSNNPTSLQELIQPGKCSIINLKGVKQELQEVIVYKLMKDLFDERKKGNIPPFFTIIEEAHNYVPERNFGEAKSSSILRQISSEGRKFGLGLAVISQRPSRVDKSVLSQCGTQIILKVTNPNDVKAIANSVEGITYETEREIKNITIGTAMVTGLIDLPVFVNVRPRMTKHGGEAVDMLQIKKEDFLEEKTDGELLQIIKPKTSVEDLKLMHDGDVKVKTNLIPCLYLETENFNLLFNLNTGELVKDIEDYKGEKISINLNLSPQQKRVFNAALNLKEFTAAELFGKSGVQFSEIYDIVNILVNKGYFVKDGTKFKISNNFSLNFEDFSVYDRPDFFRVTYDKKLDKKHNSEEIKAFLSNFIDLKNSKECWLVCYGVNYE
ncbi:MAG: DUF87 domain-containing protein [Nanoarchaeota archaeon]|nr:DUF87 domain-containing protein [Nanoarchaeota archaeon]